MAETFKNITDTLIIPKGSRERFVVFRDEGAAESWFGNGVLLAGLSELVNGYLVVRPRCRHHFVGVCTRGRMGYRLDGDDHALETGDLLFLRAGGLHHYWADNPLAMIWWHLDAEHRRWVGFSRRESHGVTPRRLALAQGLMEAAFDESQSLGKPSAAVPKFLCELILSMLEREIGRGIENGAAAVYSRSVDSVWREVAADPSRKWTVEGLARRAGLSTPHFHAVVKQCVGDPPMTVVRGIRIERAKALLRAGLKLEAVAEMTGYDSPFSLSRAFKKVVGSCPRSFMRAVRR